MQMMQIYTVLLIVSTEPVRNYYNIITFQNLCILQLVVNEIKFILSPRMGDIDYNNMLISTLSQLHTVLRESHIQISIPALVRFLFKYDGSPIYSELPRFHLPPFPLLTLTTTFYMMKHLCFCPLQSHGKVWNHLRIKTLLPLCNIKTILHCSLPVTALTEPALFH